MSDLVESASRNTISLDFFPVHEIRGISVVFCSCFEIVLAWHPYIRQGSIKHSRFFFLYRWRGIYFSFLLALLLMKFQCCVHRLILKVPKSLNRSLCLNLFLLIKMLICGHSLFKLMTIISVFFLFSANLFLKVFFSTMSGKRFFIFCTSPRGLKWFKSCRLL